MFAKYFNAFKIVALLEFKRFDSLPIIIFSALISIAEQILLFLKLNSLAALIDFTMLEFILLFFIILDKRLT
ncbi:Uncharacterised protein [Chlamydia trachomatis]|nr:Uncharacterised protein [Chlamydia trachomatis]